MEEFTFASSSALDIHVNVRMSVLLFMYMSFNADIFVEAA